MNNKIYAIIISLLLLASSGCMESEAVQITQPVAQPKAPPERPVTAAADACKFIMNDEIERLQGKKVIEAKSSSPNTDNFIVSQCYYVAEDNAKSVVLSLYRADAARPQVTQPKEFWKARFAELGKDGGKTSSRKKKEKEFPPPRLIAKLGDQAYWLDNKLGGALYVLNGDEFLRISIGGTPDENARIRKAKTLAEAALKRL